MKAILGGKDARSVENSRAYYPDFRIANNNFKVVNGLGLGFWGKKKFFPFFLKLHLEKDAGDAKPT
jgi:hypothetical protein